MQKITIYYLFIIYVFLTDSRVIYFMIIAGHLLIIFPNAYIFINNIVSNV